MKFKIKKKWKMPYGDVPREVVMGNESNNAVWANTVESRWRREDIPAYWKESTESKSAPWSYHKPKYTWRYYWLKIKKWFSPRVSTF